MTSKAEQREQELQTFLKVSAQSIAELPFQQQKSFVGDMVGLTKALNLVRDSTPAKQVETLRSCQDWVLEAAEKTDDKLPDETIFPAKKTLAAKAAKGEIGENIKTVKLCLHGRKFPQCAAKLEEPWECNLGGQCAHHANQTLNVAACDKCRGLFFSDQRQMDRETYNEAMEALGNARVILRVRGYADGPVPTPHIKLKRDGGGITLSTKRLASFFRYYNQLDQQCTQATCADEVRLLLHYSM